jgi:membrane protease YdiL (CAAX protease family)
VACFHPILASGYCDCRGRGSCYQQRFSLAEFVVGGAIVIAHNVYHCVPNEVPLLFLLGWVRSYVAAASVILSIRLRDGGWKGVGLKRPESWRKTIVWGILAGVLIIAAGQLTDFVNARTWHRAVKGPAVIEEAKTTWKGALLGLGLVWTFAAFGEEMSHRGYLMTRAADVGDRSRLAYFAALLTSSVLFATDITTKAHPGFCSRPCQA